MTQTGLSSSIVWIARALEDAAPLAAMVRACGRDVIVAPVLHITPDAGAVLPSPADVGAILVTSSAAVRSFDTHAYVDTPVIAVGTASADAARVAGFKHVMTSDGLGVADAYIYALAHGFKTLWHPCGRERTDAPVPEGLSVHHTPVYAADYVKALPDALVTAIRGGTVRHVAVFSSRSALSLSQLVDAYDLREHCATITAVCISPAVAATLQGSGTHFAAIASAAGPDTAALVRLLQTDAEDFENPNPFDPETP